MFSNANSILVTISFVCILVTSQASAKGLTEVLDTDVGEQAKREAVAGLVQVKQWLNYDGQLNDALTTCATSNQMFDPKNPMPDPEKVSQICTTLPSGTSDSIEVQNYKEQCEFTQFTSCALKFEKSVRFETKGIVSPNSAALLPMSYAGRIQIHCEQVAVLAIEPKWICGAGYSYGFAYDGSRPNSAFWILETNVMTPPHRLMSQDHWDHVEKQYSTLRKRETLEAFIKLSGQVLK